MSVSMWSYRPEVCDGGGCPGDCDLCDKPKNMEDEDEQAENAETRLSMIEKILAAINWRIRITGDGVIHVVPIPEPYEEGEE